MWISLKIYAWNIGEFWQNSELDIVIIEQITGEIWSNYYDQLAQKVYWGGGTITSDFAWKDIFISSMKIRHFSSFDTMRPRLKQD